MRGRARTRPNNGANMLHRRLFSTKVDSRAPHPKTVPLDLVCTTKQETYLTWNGTTSPMVAGTISAKGLIDTIAGTSVVWDKVQFKKFQVYAVASGRGLSTSTSSAEWPSLTVTLNSSGVSGFAASDKPSFYCDSVPGQRRAHLNITPNRLFQESWLDATNTEPLLTILTEPLASNTGNNMSNYACYVQFSCVLRSTVGTFQNTYSETPAVAATSMTRDITNYGEFAVTVINTTDQPVPIVSDPTLNVVVTNTPLPVTMS